MESILHRTQVERLVGIEEELEVVGEGMTYHVDRGEDPIKLVLADSKAFVPRFHTQL